MDYDRWLDDPDPLICEEHDEVRPCKECAATVLDFEYERLREAPKAMGQKESQNGHSEPRLGE